MKYVLINYLLLSYVNNKISRLIFINKFINANIEK